MKNTFPGMGVDRKSYYRLREHLGMTDSRVSMGHKSSWIVRYKQREKIGL